MDIGVTKILYHDMSNLLHDNGITIYCLLGLNKVFMILHVWIPFEVS